MWWISAIGNAIGIIAGLAEQEILMHIMFGISFMAFSHKYAMIAWRLVYERMVGNQPEAIGDTFLMNELNGAGILFAIYLVMVIKIGVPCILFSPLQGVIIWVISSIFGKNPPPLGFLMCYAVELIGALIIAL